MGGVNRPLLWLHGEVKSPPFSRMGRLEIGFLLRRLQEGEGLGMPASRPMPAIGRRCHELRVRDGGHNWRVFYRLDVDAVVILGVHDKRTQTTPRLVLDGCLRRAERYDRDVKGDRR